MVQNAMNRVNISLQEFASQARNDMSFERNDVSQSRHSELDSESHFLDNILQYFHNDIPFVTIGKINNKLLKTFDIQQDVFYAEINCDTLKTLPQKRIIYTELNRFPEVSRDLALLVDKKITYKEIEDLAFKTERKLLKSVNLFDAYEGKNIEDGKKSYAVRFILSNKEKTLTNNEINHIMDKLIAIYEKELKAVLR